MWPSCPASVAHVPRASPSQVSHSSSSYDEAVYKVSCNPTYPPPASTFPQPIHVDRGSPEMCLEATDRLPPGVCEAPPKLGTHVAGLNEAIRSWNTAAAKVGGSYIPDASPAGCIFVCPTLIES